MQVEISLFGHFRRLLRDTDGRLTLTVIEGTTVRDVLKMVQVPEAEVGPVSVNAQLATVETPLRDGDRVCVFAPIGGG